MLTIATITTHIQQKSCYAQYLLLVDSSYPSILCRVDAQTAEFSLSRQPRRKPQFSLTFSPLFTPLHGCSKMRRLMHRTHWLSYSSTYTPSLMQYLLLLSPSHAFTLLGKTIQSVACFVFRIHSFFSSCVLVPLSPIRFDIFA